jgi:hypothetical protein
MAQVSGDYAEGIRRMAKKQNVVEGDEMTLSLPEGARAHLEAICRTHLYGKNASETAAQFVLSEIRRLIVSGELDKLLVRTAALGTAAKDPAAGE